MHRKIPFLLVPLVLLVASTLSAATAGATGAAARSDAKKVSVTLMTHDSFAVSKDVLARFTKRSGISVKVLRSGDAGAALNKAILTKSHPLADVFFGVDNTLLSRALDANLFVPHSPKGLRDIPKEFLLDRRHRVTPIDYGDVCINYDKQFFADKRLDPPRTLDDLVDPRYRGLLVTENPATSSPGLAFLLATIKHAGDKGWPDYWKKLFANDTLVVDGWEQAYNSAFSGASGKGPRPLVVSYGSSPPAEVFFADPPRTDAPTGVMAQSCFRQVEFAGVIRGTKHLSAARTLIDFLVSSEFQNDVPLTMFVYPVNAKASLPAVFTDYAVIPEKPLTISASRIGRNRDRWVREWSKLLRQ